METEHKLTLLLALPRYRDIAHSAAPERRPHCARKSGRAGAVSAPRMHQRAARPMLVVHCAPTAAVLALPLTLETWGPI